MRRLERGGRKSKGRCRAAGWVGALFLVAAAGAPWAMQSSGWSGSRNIESVRVDDVAPEERGAEASSPPLRPSGEGASDREELAAFGEQLMKLWNAIPAYSPVNAKSRLTSGFGWRRGPFSGRREFHGGIDLAAARGTPVVAPADGFVEAIFVDEASGRVVVLDHGNGIETLFGHLEAALVSPGQEVRRGASIGKVGTSGWRSTGPHLHYAVRLGRKYVDPRRYLHEKSFAARRPASVRGVGGEGRSGAAGRPHP